MPRPVNFESSCNVFLILYSLTESCFCISIFGNCIFNLIINIKVNIFNKSIIEFSQFYDRRFLFNIQINYDDLNINFISKKYVVYSTSNQVL